ncbi:hypothetical protein BDV32DRAFT_150433 [Aspergillus pseudonomiae]|uniref:Uncharacterized protein n=1 Tax=Aspergillus pseudonomiae TaxID=1506151 RepID=A0A5N6HYL2_9EURO|nr:uncharacterized protein BDV37DRAFT_282837 [Aspergillus pseudonomiae]KAB8259551.1 hypothetical protein BDV32DRAFT_150433 [Aspergillus pseudonomiae]KAE8404288.1 hypothetical protein BDV37DRAFT_282837 [Aspergillus pseudonomiae]
MERLADFQHIFSKEESFDNIKVVFDLLAGPPRRVSKSELAAYLCQTPNATIAKLIDTMIDWEFICRHKFYELKEGIDKFEIGDQERPYLQEFCSGWLGKIKAQEEAEENEETKKAAMEEYKALWNPFSEFIAEKTQEAWEEADIRHNYLWRSYFGSEGNPDLASEFPVPRSPARTQGVAFVR